MPDGFLLQKRILLLVPSAVSVLFLIGRSRGQEPVFLWMRRELNTSGDPFGFPCQ
jgi:hypothetical protein